MTDRLTPPQLRDFAALWDKALVPAGQTTAMADAFRQHAARVRDCIDNALASEGGKPNG